MNLGRANVGSIVIAFLVLAGVAVAGVLAARAVVASEAIIQPAAAPTPAPGVVVDTTPEPRTVTSQAPTAKPIPRPTEPPLEIPNRRSVAKSEAASVEPTLVTQDAASDDSDQGTVYTWKDGRATRRVILQDDLVFQRAADRQPGDVVIASVGEDSIVRREARHGSDAAPVFRSESGGELMTLPGGVLVLLNPAWDQSEVTAFFDRNNIAADRRSALGTLPNGFQIETEPGFPSLNLSNALAGQDGVVFANPNWWRELETE